MLTTADNTIPTLIKSGSSIQSINRATMEINYNSLYERINTGCYSSIRTNLLKNTSFMANSSGTPTSWTLSYNSAISSAPALSVDTATSYSGTNSAKLTRATTGPNPGDYNYTFLTQNATLIPGKMYTVSAYIYSPTTSKTVWIVTRSSVNGWSGYGFTCPANVWTRINKTFVLESNSNGTATIDIGFEGLGPNGEIIYVDSVLLEEGNALGTYFDGETSGAYWESTRYNSKSIFPAGQYNTYYSTNNGYYDDGTAYKLFESNAVETTMTQTTPASYTIVVNSATGITEGMKVVGESLPINTYVTGISGATISINNPTSAAIPALTKVSFFSYKSVIDKERYLLTPLSSIFTPNRPNPGVVNLTAYRKGSAPIPLENIKMGNFGSVYNGTLTDRVYPMSKNSNFKYWNSLRQTKNLNVLSTVGLSDSSTQIITHAGPFTVYKSPFYANKIVIKTQKYDSNYPVSFNVEYLPYDLTTVNISSVARTDQLSGVWTKIQFTTSAPHNFKPGDYITTTISGGGAGYEFTTQQLITDVPTSTTFKIAATNPTITTGTGTVTRVLNSTWSTAATFTDSTTLSDGILELYYDGTNWTTTATTTNKFTSSDVVAVRMYGIRLSITKMSANRIPAEIIEISPRLILDITDYVTSFNYEKSISSSSYGMPVSGTIAGSGSIGLSNVDKYFSTTSGVSIIKDALVQGLEIKLYQTINSENIPLGTFYSTDWSENGDNTVSVTLEDYFYFLKRMKSPEISIANVGGIEASAALLILLDNAGISNYKFVKQSSTSNDDFIFDYFFTNKTDTLADTIEQIAISAQYAIYVDANNIIRAVTKEKMADIVGIGSTDFWLVGTEDWTGKPESTYLNGNYVSNISSITESKIIPITEAEIQYAGIGIARQPKEILKTPELFNDKNVPYYNASIISRGLSFVNTELWSIDSSESGSDKVLLALPYISEISNTRPSVISTAIAGTGTNQNNSLTAASQNDLIRTIYSNSDATNKKYFEILVDQERGIEFIYSQKFNGHIVIDAELIKYNGIVIDVFDEKTPQNSGRFIVFDNAELQYIKNKSSAGTSITCYSILVELLYKPVSSTSALTSNTITYEFVSDGRGQENTEVASHTAQTYTTMLSNPIKVKLGATSISSSISAIGRMSAKSVNLLDPRKPEVGNTTSLPGYLKISGPKSVGDLTKLPDWTDSTYAPTQIVVAGASAPYTVTLTYANHTFSVGDLISLIGITNASITNLNLTTNTVTEITSGGSATIKFTTSVALTAGTYTTGMGTFYNPNKDKRLAINNFGEQFITGFYKTLNWVPQKISTRMRLLEKPQKSVYTGDNENKKYAVENRGIAGLAFSLDTSSTSGVTGYFIEIEDIGNIQPAQLESVDFKNLRFYKVIKSGTTYIPVVLAKAWVNVSAVSGESIDFGSVVLNEGKSYAGTSDLSVTIEKSSATGPTTYKIYWNSNLVCRYVEKYSSANPPAKNTIGLFVRSDSEAMFDYISASAISKNGTYRFPVAFSSGSEFMSDTEAAQRGLLPSSVTSGITGKNNSQFSFEDFGSQMREAKRFNVSFEKPSVMARLISLTKTNKDYYVTDFLYSSKSAEFWVFNTSSASIGLAMDMNTPLIVSGIALEEINPGTLVLSDYLKNKSSSYLDYINLNKNKYGENAVTLSGNYLNNLDQAQKHLEWIYNKCGTLKKEFDITIFPNPLLEIGDKVRLFDSDINHTISLLGTDKVYYVSSISYSVNPNGPEMNIRIREI